MADGASVAGLVLATQAVVEALVNYAKSVKESKSEIQTLTLELSALRGLLEYIEDQRKPTPSEIESPSMDAFVSEPFLQGLGSILTLLNSLKSSLEPPQSMAGKAAKRMTWHWKKDDIQQQISKVERAKTFLMLSMTSDNR